MMRPVSVGVTLAVCVVTALFASSAWPGDPVYWRSEGAIQARLLRDTPPGTSASQVQQWLRERGIEAHAFKTELPFGIGKAKGIAGDVVMRVTLSRYRMPLPVAVVAVYQFDADARLISVQVQKQGDGP